MNDKFFSLPEEKQLVIMNAGYRVFSQNSYKKSPMSEIADAAGISKSLLFHYFHNKKELYLFLWEKCAQITSNYLKQYGCYEQKDLFDIMYRGLQAKVHLMKQYPSLSAFAVKAYYEKDPAVCHDVQKSLKQHAAYKTNATLLKLNPEQFVPGLDLQMMYQDMYWASVGYIWEKLQQDKLDVDQMEQDFIKMIDFWKKIYLRKEG
ncbi:MAG: TetR/AcrR family transcriptional regulator [Butyricicoccaceae bacterium]